MARVIDDGHVKKSRKDRLCDLSIELYNSGRRLNELGLTFSEKKIIAKAIRINDCKIKKGEPYYWQFNEDDGCVYKFVCNPDLYKVMSRIKWFDNN